MITPTHPVEGDWLKIETEEAIFGLLFAWMGFWMFKQLRAVAVLGGGEGEGSDGPHGRGRRR